MKKMLIVSLVALLGIAALGHATGVSPLSTNHHAVTVTEYIFYTIGVFLASAAWAWTCVHIALSSANGGPTREELDTLIKKIKEREAGPNAIHELGRP